MQLIYPKLLKRREDIDQLRGVELRLEDEEDVWHAKNLIAPGDEVKASTTRKAKIETDTGSTSKGPPETITLVIKVKKTEFDPGSPPSLRVAGTVVEENRAVSKDQHHTIVLKTNQKFTLKENEWDSVAWETLSDALKEDKEFLEDLIAAAINDAAQKLDQATKEKMAGVTGGMQLPPGFNLGL